MRKSPYVVFPKASGVKHTDEDVVNTSSMGTCVYVHMEFISMSTLSIQQYKLQSYNLIFPLSLIFQN